MITLHIRRVVGFVMLVPAGTLFMLYLFRPRPYVLAGAFAWAAGSMMLLVLSFDSGAAGSGRSRHHHDRTPRHRRVVVRRADLRRGAAARQRMVPRAVAIPRSMFWAIVAGAAWVIFGAALLPRPGAILVPAFLLMTALAPDQRLRISQDRRGSIASSAPPGRHRRVRRRAGQHRRGGRGHRQPRPRAGLDQRRLSQFPGLVAAHPRHAPADLRGPDRGAARRRRPSSPRAATR